MMMTIMMMMIMMMKMIIAVFGFLAISPPKIFIFFDGDDDFGDNEEDEYRYNSVNFQARTSRFCMEVFLDNIQ